MNGTKPLCASTKHCSRTVSLLILKNDFCEREISAVCDRDGYAFYAQSVRNPLGRAFQRQGRLAAGFSYDLDVAPPYAAPPTCSQRFHHSFFRCKTSRVALKFISVAFAIG